MLSKVRARLEADFFGAGHARGESLQCRDLPQFMPPSSDLTEGVGVEYV